MAGRPRSVDPDLDRYKEFEKLRAEMERIEKEQETRRGPLLNELGFKEAGWTMPQLKAGLQKLLRDGREPDVREGWIKEQQAASEPLSLDRQAATRKPRKPRDDAPLLDEGGGGGGSIEASAFAA